MKLNANFADFLLIGSRADVTMPTAALPSSPALKHKSSTSNTHITVVDQTEDSGIKIFEEQHEESSEGSVATGGVSIKDNAVVIASVEGSSKAEPPSPENPTLISAEVEGSRESGAKVPTMSLTKTDVNANQPLDLDISEVVLSGGHIGKDVDIVAAHVTENDTAAAKPPEVSVLEKNVVTVEDGIVVDSPVEVSSQNTLHLCVHECMWLLDSGFILEEKHSYLSESKK